MTKKPALILLFLLTLCPAVLHPAVHSPRCEVIVQVQDKARRTSTARDAESPRGIDPARNNDGARDICQARDNDAARDICQARDNDTPRDTGSARDPGASPSDLDFYFFYSHTCTRCDLARPLVRELARRYPEVRFHELEIVRDRENQALFNELNRDLGITAPGVPIFIIGSEYLVGYRDRPWYRSRVTAMVERQIALCRDGDMQHPAGEKKITLPLIGAVGIQLPFPVFTALIGLADGFNPCSLWLLVLMLSFLATTRRRRLLVLGSSFIAASAGVYFLFLVTWLQVFRVLGTHRWLNLAVGGAAVLIGAVNMKDLAFFRRGGSLAIPDRAKPMLFARMRSIARNPSLLLALTGTVILAVLASFLELGCTAGLPAVYTKILSARQPEALEYYGSLSLYLFMYALPLVGVLAAYVLTMGRFRLQERHGRALKAVSGSLLLFLGLSLLFFPELLRIG